MRDKTDIYAFHDYKKYLVAQLGAAGKRTGLRLKLAQHLGCQTAFVSQVLTGKPHFSLEQAVRINEFLGHDQNTAHFFLLLVQKDKAGSHDLRLYFEDQIKVILNERNQINKQFESSRGISELDQTAYYSRYAFQLLHMAAMIPQLQSSRAMQDRFGLTEKDIAPLLTQLTRMGLIKSTGSSYEVGPSQIHLEQDSVHIRKHHTNYRLRALAQIDLNKKENLHYSALFALAKTDIATLRRAILDLIADHVRRIVPSPCETLCALNIDMWKE